MYAVAPQSDGKVIIGGQFTITYNSVTYNGIARLNTDGSLDTTFNPNASGTVRALAVVQPELTHPTAIGGPTYSRQDYTLASGKAYIYIPNGSTYLSTSYVPDGSSTRPGPTQISPGRFVATQATYYLWTLNDYVLSPGAGRLLLADSKILAGGTFTTIGGEAMPTLRSLTLHLALSTATFRRLPTHRNAIAVRGRQDTHWRGLHEHH